LFSGDSSAGGNGESRSAAEFSDFPRMEDEMRKITRSPHLPPPPAPRAASVAEDESALPVGNHPLLLFGVLQREARNVAELTKDLPKDRDKYYGSLRILIGCLVRARDAAQLLLSQAEDIPERPAPPPGGRSP